MEKIKRRCLLICWLTVLISEAAYTTRKPSIKRNRTRSFVSVPTPSFTSEWKEGFGESSPAAVVVELNSFRYSSPILSVRTGRFLKHHPKEIPREKLHNLHNTQVGEQIFYTSSSAALSSWAIYTLAARPRSLL
eukprot:Blabericola_migrator_1__3980@NODE_2206_length_3124_cov_24_128230_g1370_i1_p3_GENE_NODE_2206_length_3124_cov_24_128230_g1370_i1NODE_2206_length_3124_cov_24_128230_g1370_i1_p3_ORF_typecomplete_len134_score10_60_NODE_2206_length_3124_cov_24_128230_g1370_i126093010